jgi:hypothetical protein
MARDASNALIYARRQHGRLASAKLLANHCEAQDAALKAIREAREEGCLLSVFENIELADDEVALFAGVDELAKAWVMKAHAAI